MPISDIILNLSYVFGTLHFVFEIFPNTRMNKNVSITTKLNHFKRVFTVLCLYNIYIYDESF